MEQNTVSTEEKQTKNKPKRFPWYISTILILSTLAFCLFLIFFLSEKFLTSGVDERVIAQIQYNESQVDKKPNDPNLRVQLGYSYFLNEDFSAAIEQYKTALNLDKEYFPAILNLAVIYEEQEETNKALEQATKAIKIAPDRWESYVIQGRCYRELKMYEKASKALYKAKDLNPISVDVIFELGRIDEVKGDKKTAAELYKQALEIDPKFEDAIKGLKRVK